MKTFATITASIILLFISVFAFFAFIGVALTGIVSVVFCPVLILVSVISFCAGCRIL